MSRAAKILFILLLVAMVSCEKIFMHPKPGTDNLSIINEYAKICTEKFGLEEAKGVNLTQLADSIRPYINPGLSERELFDMMSIMTTRMKEGHTNLRSIDNSLVKEYYWFIGYPSAFNFIIANENYYGSNANPDVQIITPPENTHEIWYGFLPQDKNVGYIRIPNFTITVTDAELETMMAYLKDAKGIIIDVRGNLGGYLELAGRLSSYFTRSDVLVATNFIKNGPGKNDFAPSQMKIKPSGSPYTFTKPVIVLHDRVTFSSGSLFCIAMKAMENTTTIGQTFGGGTGDIMDGFLANGWHWTISTSNFVGMDGRPTDPGIEADIPMIIDPKDLTTDAIIERAILELQ